MELNEAKKDYHAPMHTAEHILNQTMVRIFGCPRSMNAHIERKKSKCDYTLAKAPTEAQINEIQKKVNEIINQHLPVYEQFMSRGEAAEIVDLSKISAEASDTLRIIRVGNYDICACIGQHVTNTEEIGHFEILTHDFENGRWRVRWKIVCS